MHQGVLLSTLKPGNKTNVVSDHLTNNAQSNSIQDVVKAKQHSKSSSKYKQKRPDMALYVPRALRTQQEIPTHGIRKKDSSLVENLSLESSVSDEKLLGCNSEIDTECCKTSLEGVLEISCINETQSIFPTTLCENYDVENTKEKNYIEVQTSSNCHENISPKTCVIDGECSKNIATSLQCSNNESGQIDTEVLNEETLKESKQIKLNIAENDDCLSSHCSDEKVVLKYETRTVNCSTPCTEPDIKEINSDISSQRDECCLQYVSTAVNADQDILPKISECLDNQISSLSQSLQPDKPCLQTSKDEDSWETMFNDEGECLNPEIISELYEVVGDLQLHSTQQKYSKYQPCKNTGTQEYDHVVELYGFPVEFSTQDLVSAFSVFQEASYTIKWVDDSHALGIFSSPLLADQALLLKHPFVKVRPLSEGIRESKLKARHCAGISEPYKPRPATSATIARRLVSGALGLRVKTSKEQRDVERKIIIDAKERRRKKAQQKQDIWNGVVS